MKNAKILIDSDPFMTSVSLIEDNCLNEYYVEYKQSVRLTGNIYRGKVENLMVGLQSAFVNLGLKRNGFLYVGETLEDRSDLKKSGSIPETLSISPGDYCLVQVTKEEVGTKGARLSNNISLPGRYLVYLPTIDFIGVSNKITDEETREKLMKLLEKLKPISGGFIARTICKDSKKSDIVKEAEQLKELFEEIENDFNRSDGVCLLHSESDLVFRAVRDMLNNNVDSIICNDRDIEKRLVEYFKKIKSPFAGIVTFYDGEEDMLDIFNITPEIDKLLDRRVMLKSGCSLVIDHTEALTAIDVNTGKFSGDDNESHEETVFKANLEAAREIGRQIRLRNIGGIIVVDFIDMLLDEHKEKVVDELRSAVLLDRTKTRVLDMTGLGLVEISRKKVGNELSSIMLENCPHCRGESKTPSHLYVAKKIRSALVKLFHDYDYSNALVTLSSSQIDMMFSSRYFENMCLTAWKDKRIYFIPNDLIKSQAFSVAGNNYVSFNVPPNARLLY